MEINLIHKIIIRFLKFSEYIFYVFNSRLSRVDAKKSTEELRSFKVVNGKRNHRL